MITTNVFYRTFFVRYKESTGTAFAIDIENKQYLVTAAHVVDGISNGEHVGFFNDGKWIDEKVKIVGIGNLQLSADVAVLALNKQISPSYELPATSGGIIWGQDVYFLGFPYGIFGNDYLLDNGYPFPLIKKATLSGSSGAPINTFLLDGHNNPGFSGGPMVFRTNDDPLWRVGGIISAYQSVETEIMYQGKPTGLSSPTNTGIVVCPNIKIATDMIQANPIGPIIEF